MPEIPEYYRRQKLQTQGGFVQSSAAPQADRATAEAGSILTGFGLQVFGQAKKAEATDQFNSFQAETLTRLNEYRQGLDPKGDTTKWVDEFNTKLAERRNSLASLSNADARRAAGAWLTIQEPGWKSKMTWSVLEVQADQQFAHYTGNVNTYVKGAAEAPTPDDFDENMALLEDEIFSRVSTDEQVGLFSADEAKIELQEAKQRVARGRKTFLADAKEQVEDDADKALYASAVNLPEQKGFALINTVHDLARRNNLKARLTDHHKLRTRANNESVAGAIAFTTVAEVQKYMIEEFPELDASDVEKNEYKTQLQNRMRVIAEGSDVISDPVYMREMKNRGIDITDEDETFVDYIAEGDKAAYGKKPTLNGEEWESVKAKARVKYEASQTDALKRAVDTTRNLVEPMTPVMVAAQAAVFRGEKLDKETLALLASAEEERGLQEELRDATEENMHAWAAKKENRNKDARQTYEALQAIYRDARDVRDAGLNALRAERALREAGLTDSADISAGISMAEQGMPVDQIVSGLKARAGGRQPIDRKPVRKGPIRITGFAIGPENIVSKTVDGKQVEGIKTKDGREIFVGDEFIIGGKIWRYDGNGRATELRAASVRRR